MKTEQAARGRLALFPGQLLRMSATMGQPGNRQADALLALAWWFGFDRRCFGTAGVPFAVQKAFAFQPLSASPLTSWLSKCHTCAPSATVSGRFRNHSASLQPWQVVPEAVPNPHPAYGDTRTSCVFPAACVLCTVHLQHEEGHWMPAWVNHFVFLQLRLFSLLKSPCFLRGWMKLLYPVSYEPSLSRRSGTSSRKARFILLILKNMRLV